MTDLEPLLGLAGFRSLVDGGIAYARTRYELLATMATLLRTLGIDANRVAGGEETR